MAITKIRNRRDTTENWTNTNPILLDGELGFERTRDNKIKIKYGDGVLGSDGVTITGTRWNNLPYIFDPDAEEPENFGVAPEHKWEGTRLYFKNPDGTWGAPIDIGSMIKTESSTITTSVTGNKNKIISGRVRKDGYPEFLVHNKDMEIIHDYGCKTSQFGTVETTETCVSNCDPERALSNAQAYSNNNGWYIASMSTGEWIYTFNEPRVITGVWLNADTGRVNAYPSKWRVVGKNNMDDEWVTIYDRGVLSDKSDQYKVGINDNNLQHGRMYWFTENTQSYKIYGIKIDDTNRRVSTSSGGTDVGFATVRFFSSPIVGLDKYDVGIAASTTNPLVAEVSINAEQSRRISISENITIDGSWLQEYSRNYLYLIPGNSIPDYARTMNTTKVLGSSGKEFVLGIDTRRIHYESLEELKSECFLLLQSKAVRQSSIEATDTVANKYECSQGYYDYPIEVFGKLQIASIDRHRGSRTAYRFTQAGKSCMRGNIGTGIPDNKAKRRCNEFTLEMDIKLSVLELVGTTYNENYIALFDSGMMNNAASTTVSWGWTLGYMNHTKAFCIRWLNGENSVTSGSNHFSYSAPFNLYDNNWHTVSLSRNTNKTLFLHVDGKCLGIFNDTLDIFNFNNNWSIGKEWCNTGNTTANIWEGDINNIRYTLGTCLYQGKDYSISDNFNTNLIPDKTLYWNRERQCVCEFDATSGIWKDTPMIPIGHIDTGFQEHLLSDQPLGTYTQPTTVSSACKYIDTITDTANAGANFTSPNIFNMGVLGKGASFYCTPNTNDVTEQVVTFTLEKPISFDKLIFLPHVHDTTYTWKAFPRVFRFEGSLDGNTWDILIDNSSGDTKGNAFCHLVPKGAADGTLPYYYGMKKYPIEIGTPYSNYRLVFLPKNQGPTYNTDCKYTAARIMLPIRNGKPEILDVVSYCIGDTWKYGPFPITAVNEEYRIPVPFENVDFEFEGYVDVLNDSQRLMRKLGQGQNGYGETVFKTRDSIVIQVAKTNLNNYLGTYYNVKSSTYNVASTTGEVYITCTRSLS